jgi:hypothetical protein
MWLSRYLPAKLPISVCDSLTRLAPLGYDAKDRKITVNEAEAERVRAIFRTYLKLGPRSAECARRGPVCPQPS